MFSRMEEIASQKRPNKCENFYGGTGIVLFVTTILLGEYFLGKVTYSNLGNNSLFVNPSSIPWNKKEKEGEIINMASAKGGKLESVLEWIGRDGTNYEIPIILNNKGFPELIYSHGDSLEKYLSSK